MEIIIPLLIIVVIGIVASAIVDNVFLGYPHNLVVGLVKVIPTALIFYFTSFFLPPFPVAAIVAFVGILVLYWISLLYAVYSFKRMQTTN